MIDPVRGNIDQWPLHCGLMFAEIQPVEDIFGSCSQPTYEGNQEEAEEEEEWVLRAVSVF